MRERWDPISKRPSFKSGAILLGSQLTDICSQLLPALVHDLEILAGTQVMTRITQGVHQRLGPFVHKYRERKRFGRSVSEMLRQNLFPQSEIAQEPYETLTALHGFHMYLCHIEGHLLVLVPASQAMWDKEFYELFWMRSGRARG